MSNPIQGFKTKSGNRKYDYLALENLPQNDPDDLAEEVSDLKSTIEADFAPTVANTASGDIASFTDGADDYPVKDLVAHIELVQDLHGYANPWPGGSGKNLVPFPYCDPSGKTLNGITFTTNDVGKCHITGTSVGSATYFNLFVNNVGDGVPSWLKPGASYTVTPTIATGKYFCQLILYGDTVFTITGRETKTLPNDLSVYNRCAFVVGVYAGATVDDDVFPALYEGTAPTTWEPYSNICPITGLTGANVTRTGKNLLKLSEQNISRTDFGLSGTYDAERDIITISGTNERNTAIGFLNFYYPKYPKFTPGEKYVFSVEVSGNATSCYVQINYISSSGIINSLVTLPIQTGSVVFTVPSDYVTIQQAFVGIYASVSIDVSFSVQLEYGTDKTAYKPYQGDTYAVTFPTEAGTVYGGTLDVTTGVLTVDRGFVDMGTLNWQGWEESGSMIFNAPVVGKVELRTSSLICSQYKPDYTVHTWADLENGEITGGGNNNVYIRDIRYSTVADFKTAMDGVQLVYELATPVTYQCTPTEVKTILGANNIFADTGAVDVEYCADTKKYIDNAIAAAVASLS